MQVFVPYSSLFKCANALDHKRLKNQLNECRVIIDALQIGASLNDAERKHVPWWHHAATQMWRGAMLDLMYLHNIYSDVLFARFGTVVTSRYPPLNQTHDVRYAIGGYEFHGPWWWGIERVHASHRAALLQKDYVHYCREWNDVRPGIRYVWPRYQPRELYIIDDNGQHVLLQSYEKGAA